jgi:hypothetical protein
MAPTQRFRKHSIIIARVKVPHSAAALDYLRAVEEERRIMMDRALEKM